jgi:hypothetical protein
LRYLASSITIRSKPNVTVIMITYTVTNTTTDGRKERIKSAQNPFLSLIRCSLLTHHPKINLAQRSETHEHEIMADA